MTKEKELKEAVTYFTKKQVTVLLQKQIAACASAIDGDNLSQYTAKKKIMDVKLVEVK